MFLYLLSYSCLNWKTYWWFQYHGHFPHWDYFSKNESSFQIASKWICLKSLDHEQGNCPVSDQIYEILTCTIFVIWIFKGKSKLRIYAKQLLLVINLDEQQAKTVVQLSDFAKNLRFFTPMVVNISIPPPLDPKTFVIQSIFLKRSKRLWLQNWIGVLDVCKLWKNNIPILLISIQKLFTVMMTLFMMS